MPQLSRVRFAVDSSVPNYPKVRILVDGEESLVRQGDTTANDPEDLLDTDALVPQSTPRRIAFYGCGCGEFGCHCVAGLVSEGGGLVRWHDFRTVTGIYHCALPPAGEIEAADSDPDVPWTPLDLPDLVFEAWEYHRVVAAARTDRGWESRPRAVVRLLRELAPGVTARAALSGEVVAVQHRTRGISEDTDLQLPEGPVERLADSLRDLLEHHHPRQIAAMNLWR